MVLVKEGGSAQESQTPMMEDFVREVSMVLQASRDLCNAFVFWRYQC